MVDPVKTDAERAKEAEAKSKADEKAKTESSAAHAEAHKLGVTAAEARAKADAETDPAKKAEANKAAAESAQKADDARAKASDMDRVNREGIEPTTAVDAHTLGVVDPAIPAGHHRAQKFGNDPANPPHDHTLDPRADTVRMSRKTPDHPDLVYTEVHPDMVGDYARAGWNRDDNDAFGVPSSKRAERKGEDGKPGPAKAPEPAKVA